MNTIAVYAGSFNPFHIGHLNIVQKAQNIFGGHNVLVARGLNPDKANTLQLSFDDLDAWCNALELKIDCNVSWYKGFLHDFIEKFETNYPDDNIVLLRGLRNATDLTYEENQLKFIREFKPDIKTVFLMCDPEFNHISSSAIRNLNIIKSKSGDKYTVL